MNFVDRYEFERRLESGLRTSVARPSHALLYLELGGLDVITANHGQAASDALLLQCRYLLLPELSGHYMLSRLDDDKFGLLLWDCSRDEALLEARLMRTALQNSLLHWQDETFRLSVNIGLVLISGRGQQAADVLASAEEACREAKRKGGNSIHIVYLLGHQTVPTFTQWQIRTATVNHDSDAKGSDKLNFKHPPKLDVA